MITKSTQFLSTIAVLMLMERLWSYVRKVIETWMHDNSVELLLNNVSLLFCRQCWFLWDRNNGNANGSKIFSFGMEPSRLRWQYGKLLGYWRIDETSFFPPDNFAELLNRMKKILWGHYSFHQDCWNLIAELNLISHLFCQGKPFPDQDQNAMDAVVQFAINKLGFSPENIVMFGWSIGGYSSLWASSQFPDIKGVVSTQC